jgi:dTDP-4-dehydrorhamnose reductase
MNRILLIGSQGQVGQELQRTLAPLGKVLAWGRTEVDLSQLEVLREAIAPTHPTLIINAAAYTAVDRAETEAEAAHQVNGLAPQVMAQAAQDLGATLLHLSTDYVFDGQQSHPYSETDLPQPLGVYGQSKLRGEQGIRQECDRHLILRTAWVYGQYGRGNFVKTMLRLGTEREELRVVADQVGSPTWARDLAEAITILIQNHLWVSEPQPELYGTYHFTNSGVGSWYDFAIAIFEEAQALGMPLRVQRVIPIATPDYPTPAQRPAYSVLNCSKISSWLGEPPQHWRQALRQMLRDLI